jgi:hypothetical protein
MRILDIYKRYEIPPNLQEHMLRTCAIACFFQLHWIGGSVDWNSLKKMTLLHDVGNLVKFELDKYPEYLGKEIANIEHWRQVQKKFIAKYGTDDHAATQKILLEIGIDRQTAELIAGKSFGQSLDILNSHNWLLKLLYYADMRTLPMGIGSLSDRVADIRHRYSAKPHLEDFIIACKQVEDQVQSQLDVSVSEITDESAPLNYQILETFEI